VNHCATHCWIWRIFFLCCRRYSPCVVIIPGIELRMLRPLLLLLILLLRPPPVAVTLRIFVVYFSYSAVNFSLFSHLISSLLVERCTQNFFIRRNWESIFKGNWNEWSSVQNRNR
jgi:hypothetical protein